jgi:hypothetical protein
MPYKLGAPLLLPSGLRPLFRLGSSRDSDEHTAIVSGADEDEDEDEDEECVLVAVELENAAPSDMLFLFRIAKPLNSTSRSSRGSVVFGALFASVNRAVDSGFIC